LYHRLCQKKHEEGKKRRGPEFQRKKADYERGEQAPERLKRDPGFEEKKAPSSLKKARREKGFQNFPRAFACDRRAKRKASFRVSRGFR